MKRPCFAAPSGNCLRGLLSLGALLAISIPFLASAQTTFTNVPIGGGGYVTGLVVHPLSGSLVYARTDVGGTYLYNTTSQSWTQLMGQFSGSTYYSCDAMAVEPSDTTLQNVYVFIGNGGQGYVERSSNQGGSWTDTGLPAGVDGYGNDDSRWAGDRLAIDPNKAGVAFLGTRTSGLYKNTDIDTSTTGSGSTWSQISKSEVPVGVGTGKSSEPIGITFVAFDKVSGSSGSPTPVIYVGVSGGASGTDGVYESTNAGSSWSAMSGSPAYPVQGRVDSSGNLYVTGGNTNAGTSYGGVWKYVSGAWTNITPSGAPSGSQFSSLSVNSSGDILCAVGDADTCPIFYSTAGSGTTSSSWSTKTGTQNNTVPWQPSSYFDAHVSSALFGPTTANPDQVWFGDWYNVWSTPDITDSSPTWTNYEKSFEETYILAFRAPPGPVGTGALLFTGVEDDDGFRHTSLNSFPSSANHFSGENDTTGIDVYEGNNDYVYRVGDTGQTSGFGFRSTDNGVTWAAMTLPTNSNGIAMGGKIAVSAASSSLLVWVPVVGSGSATTPYYSTNSGASWTASTGAPSVNWANNTYYAGQCVASNKLTTNCFYVYLPTSAGGFYTSNTGTSAGSAFSATGTGLPSASSVSGYSMFGVKTVPGQNGGVWVNLAGSGSAFGVYTSTNYGSNFTHLTSVTVDGASSSIISATALAFGATNPTSGSPAAVYLLGEMTGDTNDWIYESDDMGKTWTKLNSSSQLFGDKAVNLEADRNVYGRVFVGTFGTGGSYGTTSILFSDNFEDGNANSWTVDSGTWAVVSNGTENVYKGTGTGFSQAGSSAWSDYSVQANITPTTLAAGEALELGLYVTSASQNYMAVLYPGAIDIVKTYSGTQTTLATKSYTISAGTTYDVELADVGGTLNLYVNGTLELTANDSTISSGMISVSSYKATGEFGNIIAVQQ